MPRPHLFLSVIVVGCACGGGIHRDDAGTNPHVALSVVVQGTGTATVTSSPVGIDCGDDCSEAYAPGTTVTLTAAENAATSSFVGWSGDCDGTGACNLTMTQARNVTATFDLKQVTLEVTKSGNGSGTVSGNGVSCGSTCGISLPYGASVTLSAAPGTTEATLSTFAGWSGAGCTGLDDCAFTVTENTTVDAAFELQPNLLFTTSATFDGNLEGIAGADAKCAALAAAQSLPGSYRAYLSTGSTAAGARFANASGWIRTDNKPVMNAITQFGGGTLFNAPVLDETGSDLSSSATIRVWTATNADGTYFGQNCNASGTASDWSSTTGSTAAGFATQTDSTVVLGTTRSCGEKNRLYCLGIDRAAVAQ
jgi:hypothetical protein